MDLLVKETEKTERYGINEKLGRGDDSEICKKWK